ncbi:type I-A CRISPR-associated protein Cas5 [Desulfurococcaceae archaeon AG1]|nr:type I-A CRISPR-associated protein Cas5 [Desulfurococcaceae archaeon AG1]
MIGAIISLELFSPLTIRIPYAVYHSGSYPLPPPSTIMGAIAYPYARDKGLPERMSRKVIKDVAKKVLYASAAYTSILASSKQLERFYQAIYQKPDRRELPRFRWGVYFHEGYIVFSKLLIFILLRDEELVRYLYCIARVGRKETIASVDKVIIGKPTKTKDIARCYPFYHPKGIAAFSAGYIEFSDMGKRYVIPISYGTDAKIDIAPASNGAIFWVGDYCVPAPDIAIS